MDVSLFGERSGRERESGGALMSAGEAESSSLKSAEPLPVFDTRPSLRERETDGFRRRRVYSWK